MPEQVPFNFAGPTVVEKQVDHLQRVGSAIGSHVIAYLKSVGKGGTFHMQDLTAFVGARSTVAPDSAGRIMRDLKRRGLLSYELVSRSESLYRMNWIAAGEGSL